MLTLSIGMPLGWLYRSCMSTTFVWLDLGKMADGNASCSDNGLILAATVMLGPAMPFDILGFGTGSSFSISEWYLGILFR
jgi:hypothetical protein